MDATAANPLPPSAGQITRQTSAPPLVQTECAPAVKLVRIKPLCIPERYEDLRRSMKTFDKASIAALPPTKPCVCIGRPVIERGSPKGAFSGKLFDETGKYVSFRVDANSEPLYRYLKQRHGHVVRLFGQIEGRDFKATLVNPDPVTQPEVGMLRPVFPYHTATLVAQSSLVEGLLATSYLAPVRLQNVLRKSLPSYLDNWLKQSVDKLFKDGLKSKQALKASLGTHKVSEAKPIVERMLLDLVMPRDPAATGAAHRRANLIAGVCILHDQVEEEAEIHRRHAKSKKKAATLGGLTKEQIVDLANSIADRIEFKITDEQLTAVVEILTDLDSGMPSKRLLSGDVGSGKTVVYAIAVCAMAQAGHQVAVILPSEPLAEQVYDKLRGWFDHLSMDFVAGSRQPSGSAIVSVGTSAILSRSDCEFDLVVVDEQQRFSRAQREGAMAAKGHLLEVTATAIPRSQALVEMGLTKVSTLQQSHVKKEIVTRIWRQDQRAALFTEIRASIAAGEQVLVIYPAKAPSTQKEGDVSSAASQRSSVTVYVTAWEKAFPGRVRICHGGLSAEENKAAILDVTERRADILASTTLVEVGIDIPGLRRIVIVEADMFGASTLHQLRGRVARTGGRGHCDFYLPRDPRDISLQRLEMLCTTSNGFEIAEKDRALRGSGDITRSGHRQKGKLPDSPFPNHEVPPAALLEAARLLQTEFGID